MLIRFGRHIRQLRRQRGWSQEELAARADFHPTYVGGIERGERNLSLKAIMRIAAALECPAWRLLTFSQEGRGKQSFRKKDIKALVVGDDARLEPFFAMFCEGCEYLDSFLGLDETANAFAFVSTCCKHCQPLCKFRQFSQQQPNPS